MPSGLTLASNGTLSGTPTSSGNFSFTARATDAFSYTGTRSYTLTIVAGSMAITPATLPAPIYSSSYSQQLTVSGGVAPYTFSINGGSLPTGIALSSTGTLTGSPSSPGTYTFSVTAVDSSSNLTSVSQSYTLTIATPFIDITPITLPAATVGHGVQHVDQRQRWGYTLRVRYRLRRAACRNEPYQHRHPEWHTNHRRYVHFRGAGQ
ncbi:Ig domain-containing protein [Pseudomonas qingdaonensis]|nr:Ig domain-containing protein [Pseudomonas qingdaonensis]